MRKKLFGFKDGEFGILWCIVVLFLSSLVLAVSASATQYYVGDGSDGALTISSTRTEDSVKSNITAQASSSQKNVTINSSSGFADGDLVLIVQIQGTGAGNYEFNRIDSISGSTLTMRKNIENSYQSTGAQVIRDLEITNIPVIMSSYYTNRRSKHEDIDSDAEGSSNACG